MTSHPTPSRSHLLRRIIATVAIVAGCIGTAVTVHQVTRPDPPALNDTGPVSDAARVAVATTNDVSKEIASIVTSLTTTAAGITALAKSRSSKRASASTTPTAPQPPKETPHV
ncbi:MAG: hypothetical protein LBH13_02340 [Cellulomonadaceae bacterium]|jgi:hypothetical protein|nr:hypothetical protein [Cellulomonadaceae bacterium]